MQTSLVNLPEDILTRELWRDCCLKEIDEMRDLADIRPDIFIRMTDTSMVKNTDQTELLKFGASSLGWQHTLRVHWDAARSKETGYLPKKLQLKIMNKINKDRTIQIILNIMFIGCLISLAILLPFAVGGRDLALEKQNSDIMGCFFTKNFTAVFLIFFSALIIHRIILCHIIGKYSNNNKNNNNNYNNNNNQSNNCDKIIRDLKRKKDEESISHDKRQLRRMNALYICFFFAGMIISIWADLPVIFSGDAASNSFSNSYMNEIVMFDQKNESLFYSLQKFENEQIQDIQQTGTNETSNRTNIKYQQQYVAINYLNIQEQEQNNKHEIKFNYLHNSSKSNKWNIKIVDGTSPFLILAIVGALVLVSLLIAEVIVAIKVFDSLELKENEHECRFYCLTPHFLCANQDDEEDRNQIENEIININQNREIVVGKVNVNQNAIYGLNEQDLNTFLDQQISSDDQIIQQHIDFNRISQSSTSSSSQYNNNNQNINNQQLFISNSPYCLNSLNVSNNNNNLSFHHKSNITNFNTYQPNSNLNITSSNQQIINNHIYDDSIQRRIAKKKWEYSAQQSQRFTFIIDAIMSYQIIMSASLAGQTFNVTGEISAVDFFLFFCAIATFLLSAPWFVVRSVLIGNTLRRRLQMYWKRKQLEKLRNLQDNDESNRINDVNQEVMDQQLDNHNINENDQELEKMNKINKEKEKSKEIIKEKEKENNEQLNGHNMSKQDEEEGKVKNTYQLQNKKKSRRINQQQLNNSNTSNNQSTQSLANFEMNENICYMNPLQPYQATIIPYTQIQQQQYNIGQIQQQRNTNIPTELIELQNYHMQQQQLADAFCQYQQQQQLNSVQNKQQQQQQQQQQSSSSQLNQISSPSSHKKISKAKQQSKSNLKSIPKLKNNSNPIRIQSKQQHITQQTNPIIPSPLRQNYIPQSESDQSSDSVISEVVSENDSQSETSSFSVTSTSSDTLSSGSSFDGSSSQLIVQQYINKQSDAQNKLILDMKKNSQEDNNNINNNNNSDQNQNSYQNQIQIQKQQISHIDEQDDDNKYSRREFIINGILTTIFVIFLLIVYGFVQELLFMHLRDSIDETSGEQSSDSAEQQDSEYPESFQHRIGQLFIILIPTILINITSNLSFVISSIMRIWGMRHRRRRILERNAYTEWLIEELKAN